MDRESVARWNDCTFAVLTLLGWDYLCRSSTRDSWRQWHFKLPPQNFLRLPVGALCFSTSSSGHACGSPSTLGASSGTRSLIVAAKHTKVTRATEVEMVSTKKLAGYVFWNLGRDSCCKLSCLARDFPDLFVEYIMHPPNKGKPQWNKAWQLFLHHSCTDREWKRGRKRMTE